MDEPDECEGRRRGEDGAGGTDGLDLELRPRPSAVGIGECRGSYARLLAQQLGSDYEVAEVLEEALVVGATETRIDCFLRGRQ